jgi:hypothetical protein
MDVVLAFLPWKFIWSLQMGKKERIGVVVAMSMGVLLVSHPSYPQHKLTGDVVVLARQRR